MDELKPNRMLVVLAHPDDESFAVGGTLAKYAHQGVQVILLCATRGEAGIPGVAPVEAGKIREQELLRAAKYLGIGVYFLGYQDGELPKLDPAKLADHIGGWIDMVQPQVILTFGPDGVSGHPDHVAVSHVVTLAVEQFSPNAYLLFIVPSEATVLGCGVSSSHVRHGELLVSVDISDYKIEKMRAIESHVSQHPALSGKPEEALDQIPCHEYFTIARALNGLNGSANWFEGLSAGAPQQL